MRAYQTRFIFNLAAALLLILAASQSQAQPAHPEETAIRTVLESQVAAWNRSDIPAFMESYENSIETTFIGKNIAKGYGPILERYKKSYSTHEQMGTLTFHDIDVRLLPHHHRRHRVRHRHRPLPPRPHHPRRSRQRRRHIQPPLAQNPRRLENHPRPHQLVPHTKSRRTPIKGVSGSA